MKVITVGYSTFNGDQLEGKSLEQLEEMFPDMREDVFKELAGKLGAKKAAKPKKVKESED